MTTSPHRHNERAPNTAFRVAPSPVVSPTVGSERVPGS
jgi:hypothetical protein